MVRDHNGVTDQKAVKRDAIIDIGAGPINPISVQKEEISRDHLDHLSHGPNGPNNGKPLK